MRSIFCIINNLKDNYSVFAKISLDQDDSVEEGSTYTLKYQQFRCFTGF